MDPALVERGIALVRAPNPSALTLDGTNTWIVGNAPCWVVDPGPALMEHVVAVAEVVSARGGLGGVALTHGHLDHAEGVADLLAAAGVAPVARSDRSEAHADVALGDEDRFGPFVARALPGHAPDHLVLVHEDVAFTGDAVLGAGSVFVEGQLREYLEGLERLRSLDLALLCPGHGPLVTDPRARIGELIEHRRDRDRRLGEALASGLRSEADLLDAAWSEVPAALRPVAALSLRAHLEAREGED